MGRTGSAKHLSKTVTNADREVFYLDASALMKLVRVEHESAALRNFVSSVGRVSSDLAFVELSRTARRISAEPTQMLRTVSKVIAATALMPLNRQIAISASDIDVPGLRALDAIHIATALALPDTDGFVTYDERQAAAARLCGLDVFAPG